MNLITKHKVGVSQFLEGMGNIINVTDWVYFPYSQIYNGKNFFSHKSVLTALGINKNLWPSNGSHTLDMHSLGLMNIGYQPNGQLKISNHFGYPHLGRPIDHFQVTPFDAIYVDNKINPHIKLDEDNPSDLDSLNSFILNEVEPWYLGLQNQKLGSQARANYTYYAHRRARNSIVLGFHVTPTTSDGDYTTEPNAKLKLRAGEYIHVFPGTHFKAGSEAHIKIEYLACPNASGGN